MDIMANQKRPRIKNIVRRKVVVECGRGEFVVMWHDGSVSVCMSARTVIAGVGDRDRRDSRGASVTVTELEWRNTPPGFVPPVSR